MKNILISGINGYLGSSLAKKLSGKYSIVGLEKSTDNLFRIQNCGFKVFDTTGGVPLHVFSEEKIDCVIHTATLYGRNNETEQELFESNLRLPFNLLLNAIEYKCPLFINTDTVLNRYMSAYAMSKCQFSDWLMFMSKKIKVVNIQLEHFYGPDGPETNFITSLTRRLLDNEKEIKLTKGEQERDFIFISDVVDAYETVIDNIGKLDNNYSNFQVATNERIQLKELILLLKSYTGSTSYLNFGAVPYRENELMKSTADNSGLLALGWKPRVNIRDGLKMMCNK